MFGYPRDLKYLSPYFLRIHGVKVCEHWRKKNRLAMLPKGYNIFIYFIQCGRVLWLAHFGAIMEIAGSEATCTETFDTYLLSTNEMFNFKVFSKFRIFYAKVV